MERSAAENFRALPELAWLADEAVTSRSSHDGYLQRGTSWVAVDEVDRPIGFLLAEVIRDPAREPDRDPARDPARQLAGELAPDALPHAPHHVPHLALPPALHIRELSVHGDHQGRGLGRALLQTAIDHARSIGCATVTLTTFIDVPWNAPFYARCGFVRLDDPPAESALGVILAQEMRAGLPGERRCAMRLDLSGDGQRPGRTSLQGHLDA